MNQSPTHQGQFPARFLRILPDDGNGLRRRNVIAGSPLGFVRLRVEVFLNGIQISNSVGVSIDVFFQDGRVVQIIKSVPARDISWVHEGQSIADVIVQLKDILTEDKTKLGVIPIVHRPEGRAFDLRHLTSSEKDALLSFDGWEFDIPSEKPLGAMFHLYYSGSNLERILYERPRVDLP